MASWAADCVDRVRPIFDQACLGDDRVDGALAAARAFARGEVAVAEAIAGRGGDAGAAARAASTPAARAVAYGAEQAAAVAHMGAHGLIAAGYAAMARALADDGATAEHHRLAVEAETAAQRLMMTEAVHTALSSLPLLGENRAGPLMGGRAARGLVGLAIRLIQSELQSRS